MREIKAGFNLVFGTLIGWLYFFLILGIWLLLMIGASSGNVREILGTSDVWWLLLCYFFPVWIGMSQLGAGYRSVLSCGGLFCVPRLTKSMKRFAIISGFTLAFMCALPLLLAKWPQEWERYVAAVIWFTLLAAAYLGWSIPWPAGRKNATSFMIWILWLVIFIRLVFASYLSIQPFDGWLAMLAAGIFLCVIYCGPYKDKQIKSAHRQLAASTTDINEDIKQAKLRITSVVERFFIGRLTQCSQKHKYLWGAIYPCLGILLSCGRQTLLIALALAIMWGFLPTSSLFIIVFIMIMVISGVGLYIKLPVHSQMLTAGGRRERFYGTIATAIGFSLVTGLMFALIAIVSQLIAPIIPPFVYRGETIIFTPLTLYPAFIVMGLIPMIFGLSLCFERAPLLTGFLLFIPVSIVIFSVCDVTSVGHSLVSITLLVTSCWVFLIFVSWLICYKKDLILQTDKI